MPQAKNPLHLGASLYVPATRGDLPEIVAGAKLKSVRSIIICLEDSVLEADVSQAIKNLKSVLPAISADGRMFFVRPRNVHVLGQLMTLEGLENLAGFVIPKATADSLPGYLEVLRSQSQPRAKALAHWTLMPTLETKEVFEPTEMTRLHALISHPSIKSSILSLRIGGNDLFNVLGLRRSRQRTIYESPLGPIISQLVTRFKPSGFNLSSPVCEHLDDYAVLERELEQDLEHGLFGKTAIHPDQVPVIEKHFCPSEKDFRMAQAMLKPGAPAVFRMYGMMCEVATHSGWAKQILERAEVYGIFGKEADLGLVS